MRIAIVGAGMTGTLAALHLARHAAAPVALTLIDRRARLGPAEAALRREDQPMTVPVADASAFPRRPGAFRTLALGAGDPGDRRRAGASLGPGLRAAAGVAPLSRRDAGGTDPRGRRAGDPRQPAARRVAHRPVAARADPALRRGRCGGGRSCRDGDRTVPDPAADRRPQDRRRRRAPHPRPVGRRRLRLDRRAGPGGRAGDWPGDGGGGTGPGRGRASRSDPRDRPARAAALPPCAGERSARAVRSGVPAGRRGGGGEDPARRGQAGGPAGCRRRLAPGGRRRPAGRRRGLAGLDGPDEEPLPAPRPAVLGGASPPPWRRPRQTGSTG